MEKNGKDVLILRDIMLIIAGFIFSILIFIPDLLSNFIEFLFDEKKENKNDNKYYNDYKEIISDSTSDKSKPKPINSTGNSNNTGENNKTDFKDEDVVNLMAKNLAQIKLYYDWSRKQAKASFRLAWTLCVLGFFLIVFAVVLPLVYKDLSVYYSIIPAIGGAITELIAGTALIVYRNSVTQLNHYHKSLHEDERFLSSVNLLDRFSTVEQRDEMLYEILKSEIDMNIIDTKKPNEKPTILLKRKPKNK